MPDHLVAAAVALLVVGCFLAGAVRAWWTAPVVAAVERLRSDLARKDPRP